MREILTYQSIKENPKSARDTKVSINKKNPKTVRDIDAKCPTTGVRLQPTVQLHFPITAFQNDL